MPSCERANSDESDSLASFDELDSDVARAGSESLGLLVWLAKIARDESLRIDSGISSERLLDLPKVVGRYRLESLLGAGGYGAVFRALDSQLHRSVALKLAWPGVLMDP